MTKAAVKLELFRRFDLEYPRLLADTNSGALRRKSGRSVGSTVNSETVCRKSPASAAALPIHHAVNDESWCLGQFILNLSWALCRTLLRQLMPPAPKQARQRAEMEGAAIHE